MPSAVGMDLGRVRGDRHACDGRIGSCRPAVRTPLATPPAASNGSPSSRSVWTGVHRGTGPASKDLYGTHCLACHGETLEGSGPVRPLTGPDFAANWNGLSMGDVMLERTRTTMPMDKPGTLSRQQIADVLSYVLSVNKLPAGDVELPRQSELLTSIKFLAQKPSGDPLPDQRQTERQTMQSHPTTASRRGFLAQFPNAGALGLPQRELPSPPALSSRVAIDAIVAAQYRGSGPQQSVERFSRSPALPHRSRHLSSTPPASAGELMLPAAKQASVLRPRSRP